MAIGTPSVPRIDPFDATNEQTIEYYYTGDQQNKIEIVIQNNDTGTEAYTGQQTTMRFRYVIPAGELTNGIVYRARLRVIDKTGTTGEFSNWIVFHCFSTPTFEFSNLTDGTRLIASQYDLDITYQQSENEPLNTYIITLYDDLGARILDSGTLRWVDLPTHINVAAYRLNGLVDNGKYFISLSGTTVNGIKVLHDRIGFSVEYSKAMAFSVTELTELKGSASVKIQSNVVVYTGTTDNPDLQYPDGTSVDLNDGQYGVTFDEDYAFGSIAQPDFALRTVLSHLDILTMDNCFLVLSNSDKSQNIYLWKRLGRMFNRTSPSTNVEKIYVDLISTNPISFTTVDGIKQVANYTTHSNSFLMSELVGKSGLIVNLIKKDGLYSIAIELKD